MFNRLKYVWISLGFIFWVSIAWGRDASNLLARLLSAQGKEKYEICRQLVELFEGTDNVTALKYALMMEETANTMGQPHILAQARLTAAHLYLVNGSINQAFKYSIEALKWLVIHGPSHEIAQAYFISGICLHASNNLSLAAEHLARALMHFEKCGNAEGQAKILFRLAIIFQELKDYQRMHRYTLLACSLARDPETQVRAKAKYALALFLIDSADRSLLLLENLSDSLLRIRDMAKVFIIHNTLTQILIDRGELDNALKILKQDILPAEEATAYNYLGEIYTKLAHIYDLKGDLNKTLEYNKKALHYREITQGDFAIASSLNNIGGNLLRMGRLHQALHYLRLASHVALSSGNIYVLKVSYDRMAECFLAQGRLDSLFFIQRQRQQILDSINNVNSLNQTKVLFDYVEHQREIEPTPLLSQARLSLFGGLFLAFLLLTLGIIVGLVWRYKRMKVRFREALKESRYFSLNLERRINEIYENQKNIELKLSSLAESIPLGVGFADANENFVYVNPALCEMLGFASDELKGKNLKMLIDLKEFERLPSLIEKRRSGKSETYFATLYQKNGSPIEVQVSASPLFDTQGQFLGTLGIIIDLTERNQMLASLREAKEKALESERLKSNFLAMMSHEIRTPLNAIVNGVELVFANELKESERALIVNEIQQSARALLEMWENLILLSKLRSGLYVLNKKWIQPALILQEKLVEFRELTSSSNINAIDWKVSFVPNESYEAYTDDEIISRVVHCLLSNAVKFTEKGTIQVTMAFEEKQLKFTLEDSGKGITENELNYIFSYFRQGEEGMTRTFGGAGIGLSIVKDLIDKVSGAIDLFSEPGKGTRFDVVIPCPVRKVKHEKNEAPSAISRTDINWQGKTILIAEDTDSNYQLLETVLKRYGAQILRAENGQMVVDLLKQHPEIQLILMDIHMPGMSGLEATQRIRQFNPDIIIIAQTAYAMVHDRNEILSAGCNDYIAKPLRMQALIEMLNYYLNISK